MKTYPSVRGPVPDELTCLKCRVTYIAESGHECIEDMTLEELFDDSLREVRSKMPETYEPTDEMVADCVDAVERTHEPCEKPPVATMPPGQSPDEEGFKP